MLFVRRVPFLMLCAWSVGCAPPASKGPQGGTGGQAGTAGVGGGGGGPQGGASGSGGRGGAGGSSAADAGSPGDSGGRDAGSAGAGGGGVGGTGGPSSGPDAAVVGLPDGGQTCGTTTTEIPFNPRIPDVIIAFDDSSSMEERFGTGTRYTTVRDLLTPVVTKYQDRVRWGFERFPAKGMCRRGTSGCCGEAVCIGPTLMNAAAVNRAINRMAPECAAPDEPPPPPPAGCGGFGQPGCPGGVTVIGGTPTPVALNYVRRFYDGLKDGITDRYVLLSTDGEPNCTHSAAGTGPACTGSVSEIQALLGSGVKTIVLGVSAEVSASACLDRMGQAGGAPRPGGPQAFYPAADPAALEKFLNEIITGIVKPSCTVELKAPPPDATKVAVFFDGKQIPHDPTHMNGWDYEAGSKTRVVIYGSYCSKVETFEVKQIEVRFGCPPCGGTLGC